MFPYQASVPRRLLACRCFRQICKSFQDLEHGNSGKNFPVLAVVCSGGGRGCLALRFHQEGQRSSRSEALRGDRWLISRLPFTTNAEPERMEQKAAVRHLDFALR